jgi:lysophospholipase L1-like esterase
MAANLENLENGLVTAASVADGNNAYADAKALTTVGATKTASFTAVAGTLHPVDATSASITVTLPSATGNAGARLVVTRLDSTVNTLTITGTIRGVSTSITLSLLNEAVELVSNGSGSWWPTADHKTLSTLDSRYSTTGVAAANYTTLTPFYAALANRENARCDIVVMGDSLEEGYPATSWERTIGGWLQQLMRQRYKLPDNPVPSLSAVGNARGFVGVPSAALQSAAPNNPFPWTFTGGSNNDTGGFGPKFSARVMTTGTAKAVLTVPTGGLTSFDIHHTTSSLGSSTGGYYKIDGGTAVVFSTNSASQTAALLHVASPVTSTIEIGRNAGNGVSLSGVTEYSNNESCSFNIHNCGIGGARASTWAGTAPSGGWPQAMANLTPDLIIIGLGGNEYLNAVPAATFKTNMLSLISIIRGAGMSCPIILSTPYSAPTIVGGGDPLTAFVAAAKAIAAADPTLLLVDHSVRMPPTNATNTYGLYNVLDIATYGFMIHGNANGNGYALMAETFAAAIAPG